MIELSARFTVGGSLYLGLLKDEGLPDAAVLTVVGGLEVHGDGVEGPDHEGVELGHLWTGLWGRGTLRCGDSRTGGRGGR